MDPTTAASAPQSDPALAADPMAAPPSAAPPSSAPEAPASGSAPTTTEGTPAPASSPAPPPPDPQLAQVQGQLQYLSQLEQALAYQDAAEQQAIRQYAAGMPPDQVQGMLAQYGQTAQQRAAAAQELRNARAQLEVQAQRTLLEGPARQITHARLVADARKLDPSIDEAHMEAFLQRFVAPEDVVAGAQAYVQFRREAGTAQRAANGTDRMGGPGGAAGTDFSRMSETDLYKLGIEQSERRAAQRR